MGSREFDRGGTTEVLRLDCMPLLTGGGVAVCRCCGGGFAGLVLLVPVLLVSAAAACAADAGAGAVVVFILCADRRGQGVRPFHEEEVRRTRARGRERGGGQVQG